MGTVTETPVETNGYEKYKKPIQEIVNLANTIDERYREKCFEILLNRYLLDNRETKAYYATTEGTNNAAAEIVSRPQSYPIDLTMFLQEHRISEEIINKLFLRGKGGVRPIYKLNEKRKATAQIQVSLLTAFENALLTSTGAFEFSMKNARQRCIDYNVYEAKDFIYNFGNRAGLFQNLNFDVVKLTIYGKSELANLMVALSKL